MHLQLVVFDFETFFNEEYSLTKKMTTEEYLRHSWFHVHGGGLKRAPKQTQWITHKLLPPTLQAIDWASTALLGHHLQFDAAILAWHYGIVPARYIDTLAMASLLFGPSQSVSLENLAKKFGLSAKNVPYDLFKGMRELDPVTEQRVAVGCCRDECAHDPFREAE